MSPLKTEAVVMEAPILYMSAVCVVYYMTTHFLPLENLPVRRMLMNDFYKHIFNKKIS